MEPRLKSAFWVDAFLRRAAAAGLNGAVLRKGAEEAGTVFVVVNHLDGTHTVLGPPPGPSHDADGTRLFERLSAERLDWPAVRELLDRRTRHDDDHWRIEVDDRTGLAGISPVQFD
jgi:hypothetical protein